MKLEKILLVVIGVIGALVALLFLSQAEAFRIEARPVLVDRLLEARHAQRDVQVEVAATAQRMSDEGPSGLPLNEGVCPPSVLPAFRRYMELVQATA